MFCFVLCFVLYYVLFCIMFCFVLCFVLYYVLFCTMFCFVLCFVLYYVYLTSNIYHKSQDKKYRCVLGDVRKMSLLLKSTIADVKQHSYSYAT